MSSDKHWTFHRVKDIDDKGEMLGSYQSRRDVNTALKKIAHATER